jgi:hypothetical protein
MAVVELAEPPAMCCRSVGKIPQLPERWASVGRAGANTSADRRSYFNLLGFFLERSSSKVSMYQGKVTKCQDLISNYPSNPAKCQADISKYFINFSIYPSNRARCQGDISIYPSKVSMYPDLISIDPKALARYPSKVSMYF